MLILDKKDLQKNITINQKKIAIKTDFRSWIKFSCVLNDPHIDANYKISMLFDTVISPYWCDLNLNIEETVQALLEFYNCNKK